MRAVRGALGVALSIGCFAVACRRKAPAPASRARPRATVANVAAPALFADPHTTTLTPTHPLSTRRLLGPSFAAVDNAMAALAPDGTMRWLEPDAHGVAGVHESASPCRFDPSRHATSWILSPRVALDGAGHACCIHDGDGANPQGAYCADLRRDPVVWQRAHTPNVATGVGSGAGAIALFRDDVWCTTDGGAHVSATFRGDAEQIVGIASCDRQGRAVAVAGTRSLGGERSQTIRSAAPGEGLVLVPDSPRGAPIDARILANGAIAVLIEYTAPTLFTRMPDGTSHTERLAIPGALALGAWGDHTVLTRSGRAFVAFDSRTGERRARTVDLTGAGVVSGTRIGTDLAAFANDGSVMAFATQ